MNAANSPHTPRPLVRLGFGPVFGSLFGPALGPVLGLSLCLVLWLLALPALAGPYAPAAGEPGGTAIAKDDPDIALWANGFQDYTPGPGADAVWRTPEKALGQAKGDAYDIVCLGRGGSIVLTFDPPLADGEGFDLAVFENSFSDGFLELAFVEVSSDGEHYARFPAVSLTASPVSGYGVLDPTNVHNLAGKYRQGYGTPFDFADLAETQAVLEGLVDLGAISHARIIDIVGDGGAVDSLGRPIYDPYPTSSSAGFDLDAAAGLHLSGGAAENLPPAAPVALGPVGESELAPTLRIGEYSDPDGDAQLSTRWQIARDQLFDELVLDLASSAALDALPTPALALDPLTSCFWRARVHDSHGAASEWSPVAAFDTPADADDQNLNGLPDSQELGAEDQAVDLDRNDIPDLTEQSETLVCLNGPEGLAGFVPLTDDVIIRRARAAATPDAEGRPDATVNGLLSAALETPPGDQIELRLLVDEDLPATARWLAYSDPTGYAEFPSDIEDNRLELTLQDGGPGDADGAANGLLVVQGVIGFSDEPTPADASSSLGGGGCALGGRLGGIDLSWLLVLAGPLALLARRRS